MRLRQSTGIVILLSMILGASLHAQDALTASSAESKLREAIELYNRKTYGPALETLERYFADERANAQGLAEASYYRSSCLLALGVPGGESAIDQFVDQYSWHPKATLARLDVSNYYYDKQDFAKAAASYAKVGFTAISESERTRARFRWGYSLFNLRKLEEALDQFNLVKAQSGSFGPAASYYAGFIELSTGKYDAAVADLTRASQSESYVAAVPYLLASVYYKQKKYDEVLSYISGLPADKSLNHAEEIELLRSEAYYRKGDYANALPGYENYFTKRKTGLDRSLLFRAGYSAFSLDKSESAISHFNRAASERDSLGAYASYYLGILCLKLGQKDYASNAFEVSRSFSKDPKLAEESAFQFSKVAYDLGRSEVAVAEFEKFLASFPQSSRQQEVRELLSHAYVNANNFDKAIEHIDALARRTPETDRAFQKAAFLKASEQFNMRSYPEAIRWFSRSLEFPLDHRLSAEAAFWCAETHSVLEQYEKSISLYQQTLGASTSDNETVRLRARYGLGYAYFNQKHYDRALVHFREVVQAGVRVTHYNDALIRLADCYYIAKSYPDALSNYRKAVQAAGADTDYVLLQMGMIHSIQRQYAEGERQFDRLITDFPGSRFREEALYQRSMIYFEQSRYAEAVRGFSTVVEQGKSNRFVSYALMRRAASYYNLKQYDRTAADYIRVVEKYTAHPAAADAMAPLQEALGLTGRSEEFSKYIEMFKSANPDNKNVEVLEFETARNYFFSQEYEKTIASIDKFLVNYPDSPLRIEATYLKGEAYYRSRQWDNASTAYKSIENETSFTRHARVISRLAEVMLNQKAYSEAIPYFFRFSSLAVSKKDQVIAWSGLMDCHFQMGTYDSAERYARLLIEGGGSVAPVTNRASLMLGKSAMARGNYDAAKDEFLTTLNSARDEYGAEANYLLGEIFFMLKEHKQCYETLVALNRNFAAYDVWVGKSYLLLADNFAATGDYFQARGTLKSLIDNFPLQTVKDEAAQRLKDIDEEEKKRQSTSIQDTTGD